MHVQEIFINTTKGHQYGDSGVYEAWTDEIGRLFRAYQREYGRCLSKVYVDRPNGQATPVGWVFGKRVPYEDSNETYEREVWVTLFEERSLTA